MRAALDDKVAATHAMDARFSRRNKLWSRDRPADQL